MSSADIERVSEARQRLRRAVGFGRRADHAVRIAALRSAEDTAGPALYLHDRFSVVSGLGPIAKQAIGDTVQFLYGNRSNPALMGSVMVDGARNSLDEPLGEAESQTAGAAAIFQDHLDAVGANSIAWADADDLRAVTAALDTAIALTSAELRGADAVARGVRSATIEPPVAIDLTSHDPERRELDEALEALDRTESHPELFDELAHLLDANGDTRPDTADEAAVEQYAAALASLLPTDSAAIRADLESRMLAARLRRDARATPTADVDRIIIVLDELGVDATPDDACARAARVLEEREEIARLRSRLSRKIHDAHRVESPEDPIERPDLELRRGQLRRRLQSQQRLLAATREQLAFATRDSAAWSELPGRTVTPTNSEGRPLPILVEDPTVDLPTQHGASALSVLLRLSELTQVICISDDPDLARWTDEIGDRVAHIEATGWFARGGISC